MRKPDCLLSSVVHATVPSYCLNNLQKDKKTERQKDKQTKGGHSAIILSHYPNPNLNPKSNDGDHLAGQ